MILRESMECLVTLSTIDEGCWVDYARKSSDIARRCFEMVRKVKGVCRIVRNIVARLRSGCRSNRNWRNVGLSSYNANFFFYLLDAYVG
jgi:hypothetical protein